MDKIILAYASDGNFTGIPERDAKKLTHVNYSFAVIVDGSATTRHWRNTENLLSFMDSNKDISVCLSIGGWGADGFSQAVADEAGREKLAQSIIDIITHYNFKGVDMDWEYPCDSASGIASSPDDKVNYSEFLLLMRKKLDDLSTETGIHYLLTMAAGASAKCAGNFEFDKIINCMDFINVMTYDMAPWNTVTGHHTHLYEPSEELNKKCGSKAVEVYHDAGVPYDKIVMGAAFYGRCYTEVEKGDSNGLFQPHKSKGVGFVGYQEILRRIETTGNKFFDEQAKAPFVYDETDGFFATYDDEESIRCKTDFVYEKQLAGIMFWEYNCDKSGVLLSSMYDGMVDNERNK